VDVELDTGVDDKVAAEGDEEEKKEFQEYLCIY
jgi:hypothetical protein